MLPRGLEVLQSHFRPLGWSVSQCIFIFHICHIRSSAEVFTSTMSCPHLRGRHRSQTQVSPPLKTSLVVLNHNYEFKTLACGRYFHKCFFLDTLIAVLREVTENVRPRCILCYRCSKSSHVSMPDTYEKICQAPC